MEVSFLYDEGKLVAHMNALDDGSAANPTATQLVQAYMERASKSPKHAQIYINVAAKVCFLSRASKNAVTLDEIATMEPPISPAMIPGLLASIEQQAGDDPLFRVASHRWALRMFVRNGGNPESIQKSLSHVQGMILTEQQPALQCQLRYEVGEVLLCVGRYADAKTQLEAAAAVLAQAGGDTRCRVPEDRLQGLLKACRSALDATSSQDSESSLLHKCENLRKANDLSGLAESILADALQARQQLPQLYCEGLASEDPTVAGAALLHRVVSRVPAVHLAASLISNATSSMQGFAWLQQAAGRLLEARPEVSTTVDWLLDTAAHWKPLAIDGTEPAPKKPKRSPLQELLLRSHAGQFRLAAEAAVVLAEEAEAGCAVTWSHLWSAVYGAVDCGELESAQRLVEVLRGLGDKTAEVFGGFMCGGSVPEEPALVPIQGEGLVRVLCTMLCSAPGLVGKLKVLVEQDGQPSPDELALLKQAAAAASLLLAYQAKDSSGWLPVSTAAVGLCSGSSALARSGEWLPARSLQLLLSRCPAPSPALNTLCAVAAAIVLHHTVEPQWTRFGADTSAISAGLGGHWEQLAPVRDGAGAVLSLCLHQLRKAEPNNASWLVASGELHLAQNDFPLALRSLLLAGALEDKFYSEPASLLSAGPMLRKLMLCTTALEMHSATLALCQLCKPPDLAAADKLLSQVPVQSLDESYFRFLWHLPILERLMHICAKAGSQRKVGVLMRELRDPEANQWNHPKLHAVLESTKRDKLVRALFQDMLAKTTSIDDLK